LWIIAGPSVGPAVPAVNHPPANDDPPRFVLHVYCRLRGLRRRHHRLFGSALARKAHIRGSRVDTAVWHRVERSYGTFERAFSLPDTVNPEGVKADYKNGVLTVTLPKKEVAKPRQIKVNVLS